MALTTEDPKVREQLDRLDRTIEQASWILADAVHFLQAAPLRIQTLCLDEVVTAALAEADPDSDRAVHTEFENTAIAVKMDSEQARHLVRTLLAVASRMTRPEEPVRVTLRQQSGEALLEVRAPGSDYGSQQLREMFEPFTSHVPAGSGLALASAHRIAELHGGTLEAWSSPARGTTFLARLPLIE
jgi:signal transduction histidine kinase